MICEDCNTEKDDAMKRDLNDAQLAMKGKTKGTIPTLCAECCAKYYGREWMAQS